MKYKNIDDTEITARVDNLGFGLAQVIIIVLALVENGSEKLYLIDEPEIGLHPAIQRNLLKVLKRETKQCICTTHSNHIQDILDPEISYFRVFYENTEKNFLISESNSNSSTIELLSDLGVRPSSISESNCIIWVEGPSDRLYIDFWLKKYIEKNNLAKFIENLHYSFLFYGGSNMSYFSFEENDTLDISDRLNIDLLIDAIKINPNFFIYADSDRNTKNGELGHPYTKRVLEEITNQSRNNQLWISQPKEVECYLTEEFYIKSGKYGDPSFNTDYRLNEEDLYIEVTKIRNKFKKAGSEVKETNKVAFSTSYIKYCKENNLDFSSLANNFSFDDLNSNIQNLYSVISQSQDRIFSAYQFS